LSRLKKPDLQNHPLPAKGPARLLPLLLAALLPVVLTACGGASLSSIQEQAMSAVSSYKSALYYYEKGDVMLARRAALRTDKNRPDYDKTRQLLREKIEPARLKLLRHFRSAAIRAERQGKLYLAKNLYQKTADVWIGDDKMKKEVERIDLILRQKRLNDLAAERRREDAQLLETQNRYDPPRGLDPNDAPYARELERAQDRIQARARAAWNAAKRELHENHPEVAYVEAESYQRLRPGSRRGKLLMQDVMEAMPGSLKIPGERGGRNRSPASTDRAAGKKVSAEEIRQLMAAGKWIEAHESAMIFRRNGGDEADDLLQSIDKARKKQAEAAFRRGQLAFQNEQLDKAVEAWSQAVLLQPENRDYNDSLRRATELQERFRILQSSAEN